MFIFYLIKLKQIIYLLRDNILNQYCLFKIIYFLNLYKVSYDKLFNMIDNGTQLTNLGMQLNNIGSQIQKISMDLSFINKNYSIQLQNIGTQISNFSQQIFNIGMLIKNENQQQPFGFQMYNMMNNNMNMINFDNVNLGININNNINNNINDNMSDIIKQSDEKIIHVIFDNPLIDDSIVINISQNKTIKELFNLYRIKIGENLDFFKKNIFLYNAKKIEPNDNRTILEYGIRRGEKIIVSPSMTF